ncbi:hypothetical protein Aab01nite_05790 [Paractinoplanes abujensis]|uniref:Uncharacterized protein n=1 Tax=Paractinoplanes abujensis TaxID=882441 RepID=A0A7W7CN45_9ACTN|nr:hypothetical protein [Actinoplanes abujensis]MBB4691592.1 hypothetical protein [Actinoplanes abujensis]GID16989.1 hypothetical protein Aab01nite_05790 [Actinoplanes abujensis]
MKSLRALDVATPPTAEQYERAAAGLDRIVATPPDPPRRTPLRTWMLVPALTAAVAVLLLVVPWGSSGRAYATWTPVPVPLSSGEAALVGAACKDQMRIYKSFDLDRAELVLAERRGEFVAMVYRYDNPGSEAFCLAHNLPGTDDVDDVKTGASGSSAPFAKAPAGRFLEGALAVLPEGVSITEGAAGEGVAGLTVHTEGLTVQATVHDGRWVAWWPAKALVKDGDGKWRDVPRTYDVLLDDGRTVKNAQPAS